MSRVGVIGFNPPLSPMGGAFSSWKKNQQLQAVALAAIAIAAALWAFSLSATVGIAFSAVALYASLRAYGIQKMSSPAPPPSFLRPPESHFCTGFPTQNGVESHFWKLELIRRAEHSIVLSGCYCGGVPFDEALYLIEERLSKTPHLTATLLLSTIFVTNQNKENIDRLKRNFPDRFHCKITTEVFPYVSSATNRLTFTTNHTKALVVDRRYSLIGGSGIVDLWSHQTGREPPHTNEAHSLFFDWLAPTAFLDGDYLLYDPHPTGSGAYLHEEMMNLFNRFNAPEPPVYHPFPPLNGYRNPFFMGAPHDLKITVYVTGPDQLDNPFLEEIYRQIRNAEQSIVIDHMYFHPTSECLQLLNEALGRGVEVTILTNGRESQSPSTHSFFADLSRTSWKKLFTLSQSPHLHIYEFQKPHITLHKKLIVIDRKFALLGSSNWSANSLEKHSHYENNCRIESEMFASWVLSIVELDKKLCRQIPLSSERNSSCTTPFLAHIQSAVKMFL